MGILCIDIGNSSAHIGLVENGAVRAQRDVSTKAMIAASADEVAAELAQAIAGASLEGAAYASVVPAAVPAFERGLAKLGLMNKSLHLRHDTACIGFDYPTPHEVGQDRIANVIAAKALCGVPAVVIDMGTATTFDVLTRGGYAGGIIAPGLALMTDYLHEKTALLPRLERLDLDTPSAIGKSTVEAMKIGAQVGFTGIIRECLGAVVRDLEALEGRKASILTTGGNAIVLPEGWWPGARHIPDLALIGLEIAWRARFQAYSVSQKFAGL
jgi:type III pantothenate kinase